MKNGLVLEGGGMRGMFSAGVIDEMMEQNIRPDGIIGVSAGATFGCNFKSNQKGRVLRYNTRFRHDPRYMGLCSLICTGNWVNVQFSYHTMPFQLDVFDTEAFKNDPMEFYVVCTNIDTGEAVYKKLDELDENNIDWIRASASLPIVSHPVVIDNLRLLDGGMSDSIPLKFFHSIGYTHNIVVLTQPKGFRKEAPSIMPLIRFTQKKHPQIAEILASRHIMYNQELDYISEHEQLGNTLLIYPEEELPIGRIDQNKKRMKRVYDMGREACKCKLAEIKELYRIENKL